MAVMGGGGHYLGIGVAVMGGGHYLDIGVAVMGCITWTLVWQ